MQDNEKIERNLRQNEEMERENLAREWENGDAMAGKITNYNG